METRRDAISVLLIDQSPSEAEQLRCALAESLQPEFIVHHSRSLREALAALRAAPFDVAMVGLARADAAELTALARLHEVAPELAIVVRCRESDERVAVEALAAGAQDYVVSGTPASEEVLRRALLFALARVRGEQASLRLAAIVAASADAIIGIGFDGTVTAWNAAAERIYGHSAREAAGRPASILCISPEGADQVRDALARLREGIPVPPLEMVHRRADGQTIDVAMKLSCVRGAAGAPVAVAAVVRDISTARRIEREREQAVVELREAQRIARIGSWRISPEEGASFSPELHRLLGLDPADRSLTLARWLSHVSPDDLAAVRAAMASAPEARPFELEYRVLAADGVERCLHMIGRPDPDDPRYVAGTAQDVTELRALERALRASRSELVAQRELLRGVFENAPIGMATTTTEGRFLRVNRALCEIVGYAEVELLDSSLADITHAEDQAAVRDGLAELLAGRSGSGLREARLLRRDGRVVWVGLSSSLICDAEGRPLHAVIQLADITRHKEIEDALRTERDLSEAVLAAISEGFVLAHEGRILAVNDAFCELIGYSREELVGSEMPWPFWPGPERETHAFLERVKAAGGATMIAPMVHRDGRRFDAEVTTRQAFKPDGSPLGWVSMASDVSERRRYEAELERLATHDPLTGLANHRLFHQRLAEEMAAAIRYGRALSVAILDLDHFKQINDRHGHVVGDQILESVAERLRSVVRQGELLARVGGEEFAWILPEATIDGAFVAGERARRMIASTPFHPVGSLTISVGVGSRGDLRDATALYQHADEALYAAKGEGRNRTIRWDRLAPGVVASGATDA